MQGVVYIVFIDMWAIIGELCIYGGYGVGQYSTFSKTIDSILEDFSAISFYIILRSFSG